MLCFTFGAVYCCVVNYYRKTLFDPPPEDADYVPLPEERPGGFDWGANQQGDVQQQQQQQNNRPNEN